MTGARFGTLIGLDRPVRACCGCSRRTSSRSPTCSTSPQQTSINAIVAVGMTFVILSGGIDLVGRVDRRALRRGAGHGAARSNSRCRSPWLIALAIGVICGLINGLLIDRGGLPPFIVTLGMMSIARGAALVITEGRPISGFEPGFRALATGTNRLHSRARSR